MIEFGKMYGRLYIVTLTNIKEDKNEKGDFLYVCVCDVDVYGNKLQYWRIA